MASRKGPRRVARRAVLKASAATGVALLSCGTRSLPGFRNESGGEGGGPTGPSGSAGRIEAAGGRISAGDAGRGATPPIHDPRDAVEDSVTFPLGVIAGAMRPRSVVLWTFANSRAPIHLRIFRRSDERGDVEEVAAHVLPSVHEGYVSVRVEELEPGTWYEYAFFLGEGSTRSAIGRVQTAADEEWLGVLRLGATSCTNIAYKPYRTLSLLSREEIDAFLHLGDLSYNDAAYSLSDYRLAWRGALAEPGYRALFGSVGAYFTWDDHEVVDDYDPEYLAMVNPDRLEAARTSFFEALPIGRSAAEGLWQSFRWGRTAEIFVLDCRSERRPTTREGPEAIFLSRAQMDWLKEGLLASPAHFKVIVTSVPIAFFEVEPTWSYNWDRWQGFPSQREELLDFIDREGINAWFVSGDFHIGMVHHVARANRDRRLWEIAVGPGAQAERDPTLFYESGAARREQIFPSDQFIHLSPGNSYTVFEFDPAADRVRVRFVGADERVLFDRWLRRGGEWEAVG